MKYIGVFTWVALMTFFIAEGFFISPYMGIPMIAVAVLAIVKKYKKQIVL